MTTGRINQVTTQREQRAERRGEAPNGVRVLLVCSVNTDRSSHVSLPFATFRTDTPNSALTVNLVPSQSNWLNAFYGKLTPSRAESL